MKCLPNDRSDICFNVSGLPSTLLIVKISSSVFFNPLNFKSVTTDAIVVQTQCYFDDQPSLFTNYALLSLKCVDHWLKMGIVYFKAGDPSSNVDRSPKRGSFVKAGIVCLRKQRPLRRSLFHAAAQNS